MDKFWFYYDSVLNKIKELGAACLVGMVILTCVDVVGRIFKHPLFGSVELVSILATLAIAFALPYTHKEKGHIGVEILVRLLSEKTQNIIDLITSVLSLGLFGIVTWRMVLYAVSMKRAGEVSMNLEIPVYLVISMISICFLAFFLIIVKDILIRFKLIKGNK